MKKIFASAMIAAVAVTFAGSADAAQSKHRVSADVQASCKAQAANKYSAIHFLKRRNYVDNCVAEHSKHGNMRAKTKPASGAAGPSTTGQASKN